MTSPNGITWTTRTSAADISWRAVTYGNGLFVAVAINGTGNRVMTSPDGITWTIRTSAADNEWYGVTYGNGLFVAVAVSGTGNRVMTSPDGITWTIRTSAADNLWLAVTYGNGLFVAVSATGVGNRVMTSPDGTTWTIRTSAADNDWYGVTHGNGLFVAVAATGTGNRVMTSPDGTTWTIRTSAADNNWYGVTYGNGLFVATAISGTGTRVMTSPDGATWTIRTSAADNSWYGLIYGNGLFVAVSDTGTGTRVMTSPGDLAGGGFAPFTSGLIPQAGVGGLLANSALSTSGITGTLTLSKSGSTARTATFPDAAITVAGLSVAQSWSGIQTFAAASTIIGTDPTGSEILRIGGSARVNADIYLAGGFRQYQVSTASLGLASLSTSCFQQYLTSGFTSLGYIGGSATNFGITTPAGSFALSYTSAGIIAVGFPTTIGTDPGGSDTLRVGGALTINSTSLLSTKTSFTNGAAAAAGTLTNAPAAGNPTKWIPIDDNGTTRYIPAW